MNNRKICFIWNVQNEEYYSESVKYVDALVVPEGYIVEKVAVADDNYAKAYNEAITISDAKYKVYIYDAIFIINKFFIYDMLRIFQKKEIGLFGVLGSKTIPTSGAWQESRHKRGRKYIYDGNKIQHISFDSEDDNQDNVMALDGSLLATQYDVSWREDLFKNKYYYDLAQGIEFRHKGYEVVVAKQEEPWVLHDSTADNEEQFNQAKEVFLEEYSKAIYPLVSILIPTYNRPDYFKLALESALSQTYRNIEIVIGDNSTNDATQKLMQPYLAKYKNINYINNGGNIGVQSFYNIFDKSNGEFVNYLMDDDLFHPEKIRIMMDFYIGYSDITLVTSHRQPIDENGVFLLDCSATQKIVFKTSIIQGEELARGMLFNNLNFIGEPTTVLIKRSFIKNGKIGTFIGKSYRILCDITQWLEMLQYGNGVYIADTLSYFRMHIGQDQYNYYTQLLSAIDQFEYITECYKVNLYIKNKSEFLQLLNNWYNNNSEYSKLAEELKRDERYTEEVMQQYLYYLECGKKILEK